METFLEFRVRYYLQLYCICDRLSIDLALIKISIKTKTHHSSHGDLVYIPFCLNLFMFENPILRNICGGQIKLLLFLAFNNVILLKSCSRLFFNLVFLLSLLISVSISYHFAWTFFLIIFVSFGLENSIIFITISLVLQTWCIWLLQRILKSWCQR